MCGGSRLHVEVYGNISFFHIFYVIYKYNFAAAGTDLMTERSKALCKGRSLLGEGSNPSKIIFLRREYNHISLPAFLFIIIII